MTSWTKSTLLPFSMTPQAFYSSSRKGTAKLTYATQYHYSAYYICIQALQQKPAPARHQTNCLRSAFKEAGEHFSGISSVPPLGQTLCMMLHKRFIFCREVETHLSKCFLSLVKWFGEWVTGDEKLFEFTGDSGWARIKYDKFGLWNYELCGRLSNNSTILLSVHSHSVSAGLGESVPSSDVLAEWGAAIKKPGVRTTTILVADSYYLDQMGRHLLLELDIPYLCAIQACCFPSLVAEAKKKVSRPGKTAILYNEWTNEYFCHHYYAETRIGRKYVLTNMFELGVGNTSSNFVPGCDHFSKTFNLCDHFNFELFGKTFPHRPSSDGLSLHDFLFSSTLLNIYHIWCYVWKHPLQSKSYSDTLLVLADVVHMHGVALM